jgi:hypothetical protein
MTEPSPEDTANPPAKPEAPAPKPNGAAYERSVSGIEVVAITTSVMIRGLLNSLVGMRHADILAAISASTATTVGTILHGSLADVLKVRKQCRDAFNDALTKAPAPPLDNPAPPPGVRNGG